MYKRGMRIYNTERVEARSAGLALTPLMLAERDREYLKQLRKKQRCRGKVDG